MPFEPDSRQRKIGAHAQRSARLDDVEWRDGPFAVRGQARRRFSLRRPAKDVEADVVPHDAGEQWRVAAEAKHLAVNRSVERRWLDRGPRRRPQRIDACTLVEHLRDVSALGEHGDPNRVVLDRDRATAAVSRDGHGPHYGSGDRGPIAG